MAEQPAAKFRIGFVTATVWRNGEFFNTTISRTYKDGDEYRETNSFGHADLLSAARVLQRAEDFISRQ